MSTRRREAIMRCCGRFRTQLGIPCFCAVLMLLGSAGASAQSGRGVLRMAGQALAHPARRLPPLGLLFNPRSAWASSPVWGSVLLCPAYFTSPPRRAILEP